MDFKVTFDALPVAGALLTIIGFLVEHFNEKFEALSSQKKQLIFTGALLLIVLLAVGLSLAGFITVYKGPTWREWIWYPGVDFVIALCINAGIYKSGNYVLTPKKK